MLDREKLARDIFSIASKLFSDVHYENDIAQKTWAEIACDPSFAARVESAQSSFLVPRWDGNLADTFLIQSKVPAYSVLAVDGSQIYPDRHMGGVSCYLINTGGALLQYGIIAKATFFSCPHVLIPAELAQEVEVFSQDIIDLKREEYEFKALVEKVTEGEIRPVCFMDGSLVFWQLDAKPDAIKNLFLSRYVASLDCLYKHKILVAGYISMPKSRELINLIRLGLCRFTSADCIRCHSQFEDYPCKQVDNLLDTSILVSFLKPYHRTTVFYSTSKIVESYPAHLRPAFVYCDVGSEIVRIEVPTWIAQDKDLLNYICSVAIDQSIKGYGYPVCLAEAHEQAVVKGGDREFFYHLLYKIGMEHHKPLFFSEKALKKKRIGI